MEKGWPAYEQVGVRLGGGQEGFWALQVDKPGLYTFRLARYPLESGLTIDAAAPPGDDGPGGQPYYPSGRILGIKKALIEIEGHQEQHDIRDGAKTSDFTLKLKKEPAKLRAVFIGDGNARYNAYYVYVKKQND